MTLRDTFKYRSIWMGFAILWVVFYHINIPINNTPIFFLKTFGYGGVDIFIFASGIGCYYSYLRDRSPLDFIKRRNCSKGSSPTLSTPMTTQPLSTALP